MASKPSVRVNVSPGSLAASLTVGLLLGGCSLSFPMQGFVDTAPTGAIGDGESGKILSKALDREDLRRARAALAVALDPQGNGTNVAWANPDSGAGGSFVPLAPPFPDHDGICRTFGGNVVSHAEPTRKFRGSACRATGGDWAIADLKDLK